ncbi:MAG TPA: thioredoxin family protein [Candidatus Eisenbacteria bacterium]|nr:thioredoxin family protein [Candidatus Eisenbacteria bacterium]
MTPERFAQGMTFAAYLAQMRSNKERFEQRMAATELTSADREAIGARKLKILVITEDWCGDALVGFPGLARLVEQAPDVEMRVFLRDANPDVMDQYLKRGLYRTIPVFVFFDEHMTDLARFMERQDVVTELRTVLKV